MKSHMGIQLIQQGTSHNRVPGKCDDEIQLNQAMGLVVQAVELPDSHRHMWLRKLWIVSTLPHLVEAAQAKLTCCDGW